MKDARTAILYLSNMLSIDFTEEQKILMENFDKSVLSTSLPGTGKTATCTAGLILAEKYFKIDPTRIYAMSFTNNSTDELQIRHQDYCKKMGISSRINFLTLHKIASEILSNNYRLLGMSSYKPVQNPSRESMMKYIERACKKRNVTLRKGASKKILDAIYSCNSSFIFDPENIASRFSFRKCGIDMETFQYVRRNIYAANKVRGTIPVSDIILYAVELLLKHPEVSKEFKSKCDLLLIDEFQDCSLLQMTFISLLSDRVVAIGDINQQIYEFNGACPEIVERFRSMYPDAIECPLTISFRCPKEIAEFAGQIIERNKTGGENLIGVDKTSYINISNDFSLEEICAEIGREHEKTRRFDKSVFFLYRDNYSVYDISENLYKYRVPCNISKYKSIREHPIVKDLCRMIDLLNSPTSIDLIGILNRFIPEFRAFREADDMPIFLPMAETDSSFIEVPYEWKQIDKVTPIMETFMKCQDMLRNGDRAYRVFDELYKVYYDNYFHLIEDRVDYDGESTMKTLQNIAGDKTFSQFINYEIDKAEFIKEWTEKRFGVRCMTFHSAKGLEADRVFILNCEERKVPNKRILKEMKAYNCFFDAIRNIRNERSLMFVAATRAREELHIFFKEELSDIISGGESYEALDRYYEAKKIEFDDALHFLDFSGKVG